MLKDCIILADGISKTLEIAVHVKFGQAIIENASDVETALTVLARHKAGVRSYAVVCRDGNAFKRGFPNNTVIETPDVEKTLKAIAWTLADSGRTYRMTDDVFFVSDTHFCHSNIIRYCNRPWNSGKDESGNVIVTEDDVTRMNEDIISRWNAVVGKDSTVWHLGDFSFGGRDNVAKLVSRLNGRINIVLGNHDRYGVKFYYDAGFNRVYDKPVVIDKFVILSHEPFEWVQEPMFNVFGHVHDNAIYSTWSASGACVCIERHGYAPVSWKTIRENAGKYRADI